MFGVSSFTSFSESEFGSIMISEFLKLGFCAWSNWRICFFSRSSFSIYSAVCCRIVAWNYISKTETFVVMRCRARRTRVVANMGTCVHWIRLWRVVIRIGRTLLTAHLRVWPFFVKKFSVGESFRNFESEFFRIFKKFLFQLTFDTFS